MAAVRITVGYAGAEHTLAFARNSEAVSVERAICVACGVPWGSVTRLVDQSGAVYSADPSLFPDGKKLMLEVVAVPREPTLSPGLCHCQAMLTHGNAALSVCVCVLIAD